MSIWSRFTAWLSGWPESAEAKHGRSDKEEDLLFAEAELKAKGRKSKPLDKIDEKVLKVASTR